ncbi:MAG: response regulator [Planctomycetota bacterium]
MSDAFIQNGMTVNGLRISDGEQHRILSELDTLGTDFPPTEDRRGSSRQSLPPHLVVKVLIQQPGGGVHKFRVRARNLNNTGISLLHGGFMHIGSQCTVEVFDGSMPLVKIPGHVIRCRYLRQIVHEIGVGFDQPIDAAAVLNSEATQADASETRGPALPRLRGRVLHVDPIEADRRYLDYRLAQVGLNFRHAENALQTIELANTQSFDLVLAEYRLKPDPAPFLVKRLRTAGNQVPIIILGHSLSKTAAQEITADGASACLSKPFKLPDLIKLLEHYLPVDDASHPDTADALLSEHWPEEAFRPLIIEYVNDLTSTLEYLSRTLMARATEADALSSAQQLAATAGLYGYPKITEAANELSTMLRLDPLPTDMIFEQMLNLQKLAEAAQQAIG